ncbi:MAG: LysM peptidoglycan-binding domain-containing protein [Eubacteriales bacterium]|nr:LysM peptidoglycan-binding domain-containing protein [Eubacteriales bacterium]
MKKRLFRVLVSTLLIAALLAGPGLQASAANTVDISRDEVEYYVIPYVIVKGDMLTDVYWRWGLKFENYADDIRSLNFVDNLDLLYVGAIYLLPTSVNNVKTEEYTKVMAHTMKQGETTYDVFTAYGIDYYENLPKLKSYNHGNDLAKIAAGEKLLIPII